MIQCSLVASLLTLFSVSSCWNVVLAQTEYQVRLSDGATARDGRVEVYVSGRWQSVCSNDWNLHDADVACRQLEYSYAVVASTADPYGSGPEVMDEEFECTGTESRLSECSRQSVFIFPCTQSAGVLCSNELLREGSLRMANGSFHKYGGRLEYYSSNRGSWGTVCKSDWDSRDARVACRQMGLSDVTTSFQEFFPRASPQQHIAVTNVGCGGSETQIQQCSSSSNTLACHHGDDVGIICSIITETSSIQGVGSIVGGIIGGGLLLCICLVFICILVAFAIRKRSNRTKSPTTTASVSAGGAGTTTDTPPSYPISGSSLSYFDNLNNPTQGENEKLPPPYPIGQDTFQQSLPYPPPSSAYVGYNQSHHYPHPPPQEYPSDNMYVVAQAHSMNDHMTTQYHHPLPPGTSHPAFNPDIEPSTGQSPDTLAPSAPPPMGATAVPN